MDVWVVDSASTYGSADMVRQRYPSVRLIASDQNLGYAAGNNRAFKESAGRYILILNPDTQILAGSLDRMVDYLDQRPDVGLLAVKLVYPDGSFQHSCFRFPG